MPCFSPGDHSQLLISAAGDGEHCQTKKWKRTFGISAHLMHIETKNVHPPQPMRATKSGLQHTNQSKINIEDYGKPSKNKTKLLIDMIASYYG